MPVLAIIALFVYTLVNQSTRDYSISFGVGQSVSNAPRTDSTKGD